MKKRRPAPKARRPGPASGSALASPPGDTLRETLKEQGLSQTILAITIGRPIKTINEIIHAKTRITEETAIELEWAVGVPAHVWLALESNYRLALARQSKKAITI